MTLLTKKYDKKSPDYKWDGKLWDLKTPQGASGVDKLIHQGIYQIFENPGGILLDCSSPNIDIEKGVIGQNVLIANPIDHRIYPPYGNRSRR